MVGRHGDATKISPTAPPIEGRASIALVAFLSLLSKLPSLTLLLNLEQKAAESGGGLALRTQQPLFNSAIIPTSLDNRRGDD